MMLPVVLLRVFIYLLWFHQYSLDAIFRGFRFKVDQRN